MNIPLNAIMFKGDGETGYLFADQPQGSLCCCISAECGEAKYALDILGKEPIKVTIIPTEQFNRLESSAVKYDKQQELDQFANKVKEVKEAAIRIGETESVVAAIKYIRSTLGIDLVAVKQMYESSKHLHGDLAQFGLSIVRILKHLKGDQLPSLTPCVAMLIKKYGFNESTAEHLVRQLFTAIHDE